MSGLRPYQTDLKHRIYAAWDDHAREQKRDDIHVVGVMPTGAGKTRTVADMVAELNEPTAVIAHRQELVGQLAVALARERVRHGIVAPPSVVRDIVKLEIEEAGASYFDPNARTKVAGVDTLVRMPESDPWFGQVRRWVTDECHHVQGDPRDEKCETMNKWGRAASRFTHAKGLGVTATPIRADKQGLGRGHGGLFDAMVEGPQMQELMDWGFLTQYNVACPESDVDYSAVRVSASGDLSAAGLREAVHKSNRIVGDVVDAYLQHAGGKRGITFAVDVKEATKLAEAYSARGVPAAVIHGAMKDLERTHLMRQFRAGKLLQLCNCDILGEGVDVPSVEVVSMARKTLSYSLFAQQFGRMLRPFEGKTHGLLIDHVGNFVHHKPPNRRRVWTLAGEMRMQRAKDGVPMRACPMCTQPYERFYPACPHCGHEPVPAGRSTPAQVDGDMVLLDPEVIRAMYEAAELPGPVFRVPVGASHIVQRRLQNLHTEALHAHQATREAQKTLRMALEYYGGAQTAAGLDVRTAQRKFFHEHGIDVLSAQALDAERAAELEARVWQGLAS